MSLCNLGDHICEQYSSSGLTNITKALVKTTGHLHRKQCKICLARRLAWAHVYILRPVICIFIEFFRKRLSQGLLRTSVTSISYLTCCQLTNTIITYWKLCTHAMDYTVRFLRVCMSEECGTENFSPLSSIDLEFQLHGWVFVRLLYGEITITIIAITVHAARICTMPPTAMHGGASQARKVRPKCNIKYI